MDRSVFTIPRMEADFETRSEVDVRNVGAWAYAEHPTTEILCLSYQLPGQKTKLWTPPLPFPQEIIDFLEDNGAVQAHNVQFEQAVWYFLLFKALGVPKPKTWHCTMSRCAYRALPMGLGQVGAVLGLPIQKDKRGKYLLQKLSKPRKPTKKDPNKWVADWDLLEELYDYCILDTDTEKLLGDTIGDLPWNEYVVWCLDQKINRRGLMIDLEAVHAAIYMAEKLEKQYNEELNQITDGEVPRGTMVARMKKWLEEHDCPLPGLGKEIIEDVLIKRDDLLPEVKRVLELRKLLSRASAKKLYKMVDCAGSDGAIRGLLAYHGAGTGRWAGRLVQPHNFPRGSIKDMDALIGIIKMRDIELLEMLYGDPMEAISSSLRGMLISRPGKDFYVADFSSIEARVLMWLAGEREALNAFKESDAGLGPDIYCSFAESLYDRPINKKDDKDERQLGKIGILGCGYQMSGKALKDQAETQYKVEMDRAKADWIVETYRSTYPNVKSLWYGLENAAVQAVLRGGVYSYCGIVYENIHDSAGSWLRCRLPSGRYIWYFDPKVTWEMMPWGKEKQCLSYQGRDNKNNGVWGRVRTYGGMLTENCTIGETEVLTDRGWIAIMNVQIDDMIWDGLNWVSHNGLVYQGDRKVINFGGVYLTPDHKVLIDEEWKPASNCSHNRATATCETIRRSQTWKIKSHSISRIKSKKRIYLAMFMRLWKQKDSYASRFKSRGRNFMRLRPTRKEGNGWKYSWRAVKNSWNVQTPGVLGLAIDEGSMQTTNTSSMGKLWGARNSSLFSLEYFRKVLGRYESYLYERITNRENEQQSGLHPKKLQMGNARRTVEESKIECTYRNSKRSNDSIRSESSFWNKDNNVTLENKKRMANGEAVPVYDILNVGPLHRFTVRGDDKKPFIVSNCVQAIARDMMVESMLNVEHHGYPILLTVHDEIIAEVDEGFGSLKEYEDLMGVSPIWARDCPIGVEGWIGKRYRK